MTVNEIVDELRAARPRASDALRLQVMTIAAQPVPRTPTLRERFGGHRRLALLVPAGAALAMTAAVVIGISRSGAPGMVGTAAPESAARSAGTTGESLAAPPTAADAAAAQKGAPGPVAGRAQRYSAALSLQVEDTDALSDATQQALAIARDLGGYVVSVNYATGDEGAASMTLKVPSASAADAVTRLSSLGTILAQNVQIDDLQESLDGLDRRQQQVRARIAALTSAIDRAETDAERARLEEQRAQARAELRELRASRAATAAEARSATVQLDLRTKESGGGAPGSGSRLDRALDKALAVLAWEGVVLLAAAIAAAPFALLAAAAWATRRARRRREEERLLAAS